MLKAWFIALSRKPPKMARVKACFKFLRFHKCSRGGIYGAPRDTTQTKEQAGQHHIFIGGS